MAPAVSEPSESPRRVRTHSDGMRRPGSHVYDANRKASHLVILDAENVKAGPLATAYLDHRVAFGFHGNWCPAA
jgi:hypothetical protein